MLSLHLKRLAETVARVAEQNLRVDGTVVLEARSLDNFAAMLRDYAAQARRHENEEIERQLAVHGEPVAASAPAGHAVCETVVRLDDFRNRPTRHGGAA